MTQQLPADDVLRRIRGEYLEMPGLRLTTGQAQRLWGLDREMCERLLGALVDEQFLRHTWDGAFVRCDPSSPAWSPHEPRHIRDKTDPKSSVLTGRVAS